MEVDDDTLALDTIDAVGPGGNYLHEPHTLEHCRDYERPTFFNRRRHDVWVSRGGSDLATCGPPAPADASSRAGRNRRWTRRSAVGWRSTALGRQPFPLGDDGLPGGAGDRDATGPLAADLVVRHAGELLTCAESAVGCAGGTRRLGRQCGRAGPHRRRRGGGRRRPHPLGGRDADLADAVAVTPATRVLDAGGRVVMPGLVECHTHVVFGGDRAAEYQLRVAGATYGEIAAAGGGILSTVRATRAASFEELRRAGARRLRACSSTA